MIISMTNKYTCTRVIYLVFVTSFVQFTTTGYFNIFRNLFVSGHGQRTAVRESSRTGAERARQGRKLELKKNCDTALTSRVNPTKMPALSAATLTPSQKFDGALALVGGFFLHLTLGTLYCFGNMNTYMTSYLRKHVHPDLAYSDMVWIPTLATVGQGVFMTFSGHLEERIGVRFTVILGSTIMTLGVYLTAATVQVSVFLTVVTYGLMFGVGIALAYAPPLGVAMRWFPRHKGLVNGVIVGGFGAGAFVFNQVQSAYLNPTNAPLDDDGYFSDDRILNRVPSVFLLLGSIYGVIQAMSVLLIASPGEGDRQSMVPLVTHGLDDGEEDIVEDGEQEAMLGGAEEDEGDDQELVVSNGDFGAMAAQQHQQHRRASSSSDPARSEDRVSNVSVSLGHPEEAESLKPGQALRTREFWILWGTFFLNTQAITYINSMYKAYGQGFIRDDHFLSIVGAVAAVFNAGGRVFWGHLCDGFGYRACMCVVTSALGILYSTFYLVPHGGKVFFAVWVWGIFFCFCASFVLLPTATAQCFGTK